MRELIGRIRPTAIIVIGVLAGLSAYIIHVDATYAEGAVGAIIGGLVASLDKLVEDK